MRKDLTAKLCKKHPSLINKSFKTLWGFPQFDADCRDGWFNILDSMFFSIEKYLDDTDKHRTWVIAHNQKVESNPNCRSVFGKKLKKKRTPRAVKPIVFHRIYRTHGNLTISYNGGDDTIAGIIMMAEQLSQTVCIDCGVPATYKVGETVLCNEHKVLRALTGN